MIDRFKGSAGAGILRDVMRQQVLLRNEPDAVDRIIRAGVLAEYSAGNVIIAQDAPDSFVYFILAGAVDVELHGVAIAERSVGDSVGEMSAIDPSAPRSATIRAKTTTVTLGVDCATFIAIANGRPAIWRAAAGVIANRLRQRAIFHRKPNPHPIMFVGSSAEGLPIANQIQLGLKHLRAEVRIWTNGVFGPSGIPVDDLLSQVSGADFSVFVFGPDDKVGSRGATSDAPRDNVVFELGLFVSRLGRERTYMVMEHRSDLKIPSDLVGVTPITYRSVSGVGLASILGPVCTALETQVNRLGVIR